MPPGPVTYAIGVGGGYALKNPTGKIPYSWLIAADGMVVWQGHGIPADKLIEAELKKVRVTPELKAAWAEKMLAYAESLLGAKDYVRGMGYLDRVSREHKGTSAAQKAQLRLAEIAKDESAKAELSAQKELEKLTTGLEMPKDKLKKKEREGIAARLEAFIKTSEQNAPVAAEQAKMWVKVMTQKWEDGAK